MRRNHQLHAEHEQVPQSMIALGIVAAAVMLFGERVYTPVGVYAATATSVPTSVSVPGTGVVIPAQVDDHRLLGFKRKNWPVSSPRDLHQVYGQIFKFGNRNAASHLWSSYVLQNSNLLSDSELEMMLSGFCAISGSPVGPSEYNRYGLRLRKVRDVRKPVWEGEEDFAESMPKATLHSMDELDAMDAEGDEKQKHEAYQPASTAIAVPGNDTDSSTDMAEVRKLLEEANFGVTAPNVERMLGFMHYCCWPCVCDTQDYFWVDSKTVKTRSDIERGLPGTKRWFVVLDSPCNRPEELHKPFYQPFDGRETTLARDAAEVRCASDGHLEGATLSDNGYIIYGAFFDARPVTPNEERALQRQQEDPAHRAQLQPGRTSYDVSGLKTNKKFQDETEWAGQCKDRADKGYNSGMGEIFRKVAQISTVQETETTRMHMRARNVIVARRRRALLEAAKEENPHHEQALQLESVAQAVTGEGEGGDDASCTTPATPDGKGVDVGNCKNPTATSAEKAAVTPAPAH